MLAGAAARSSAAAAILLLTAAAAALAAPPPLAAVAGGGALAPSMAAQPFAAHVREAARRFALPEQWIWSVMRVESAHNPRAVSRAGAMGLMQIMPGTWAGLRSRHALGRDPFDPRDNIVAGAAYLREMFDRYGAPGFLAAYNAGPGRYEDYLHRGRPLPRETRAYLARLAPMIADAAAPEGAPRRTATRTAARPWTEADLFVARAPGDSGNAAAGAASPPAEMPVSARDVAGAPNAPPPRAELFVPRDRRFE